MGEVCERGVCVGEVCGRGVRRRCAEEVCG